MAGKLTLRTVHSRTRRKICISYFTAQLKKCDLFKTVREAIVLGYDNGLVDDEEFVLLNDAFTSENLPFPYYKYPEFSLEEKDEYECIADFRVKKPIFQHYLAFPPYLSASKELFAVVWKVYVYF